MLPYLAVHDISVHTRMREMCDKMCDNEKKKTFYPLFSRST